MMESLGGNWAQFGDRQMPYRKTEDTHIPTFDALRSLTSEGVADPISQPRQYRTTKRSCRCQATWGPAVQQPSADPTRSITPSFSASFIKQPKLIVELSLELPKLGRGRIPSQP